MLTTHTVQNVRRGSLLVSVVDGLCVSIGVERNPAGKPTRLCVRTATHTDPVLYATRPGYRPTPSLAREVMWGTADLQMGESLHIEPKPGQAAVFEWDAFKIDDMHSCVNSGTAQLPSGASRRVTWSHTIGLESPRLGRRLTLDAVIVVVEDP